MAEINVNGSFYSQVLCDNIMKYYKNMDLLSIDRIVRKIINNKKGITTQLESTLDKLIFFYSKKQPLKVSANIKSKDIPSSYLPRQVVSNFFGRVDILEQIRNAFNKDKKQIVILKSISGTGKSEIALKYGWESILYNVYWFKADDLDNVDTEYKDFSERFGIKTNNYNTEHIIKYTNDRIKNSKENFLFIFDNCEDYKHISSYIINMPSNAKILITTNKNLDIIDRSILIDLKPFSKDESETFIKESLKKKFNNEDIKCITDLVFEHFKSIEIRPYSLNKFINAIKVETELKSLSDFIKIYENKKDEIVNDILNGDRLFKTLNEIDKDILCFLSFMDPDFIPLEMLKEITQKDEEIEKITKKLVSYSFVNIRYNNGIIGLNIHRNFQIEIRENTSVKETIINKLKDYLNSELSLHNSKIFSQNKFQNYKMIIENILNKKFSLLKKDKFNILFKFACYCQNFHKYELALFNYQNSLKIQKSISDTSELIAFILHNIGSVYSKQYKYKEALESYQESLEIRKSKNNPDTLNDIADTLNNIGLVYKDQGKDELALTYLQEALRIDGLSCNKNTTAAKTLNNIGLVYFNKNKNEEALESYKKSLEMKKSIVCPSNASVLNNIGLVYNDQGNHEEAMKCFQESLKIKLSIFGTKNDPLIADTLNNIGAVYIIQGKDELALENFKESLSINRLFCTNSLSIAETLANIGSIYSKQGNFDLALENYQESLKIKESIFGTKNHPSVADTLNNVGAVYIIQGKHDLALENLKESLSINRLFCTNSQTITLALKNIGSIYFNQGEYEDALIYYKDSLEIERSIYDSDENPSIVAILNIIGEIYSKQGKNYTDNKTINLNL